MDDQELDRATRIDRYLKGEMNTEEKKSFEYNLARDDELKNELEKTEMASRAVRYRGLQQEVSDVRSKMLKDEAHQNGLSERKQAIERPLPVRFYAFRVAASLLLVLLAFAGIQMTVVDPDTIYQEKINFEVVDVVERSDEESSTLSSILEAYQQDNFQDVTALYNELETPSVKEKYITAAAYLQLQQYNEAVTIYHQILGTDSQNTDSKMSYWEQRSAYNLAITNLQLGEYEEAIDLLNQLKSNEEYGDYYDQLISDYALWRLRLLEFKDSLLN